MIKLTLEIDGQKFSFSDENFKSTWDTTATKEHLINGKSYNGLTPQAEIQMMINSDFFMPVFRQYLKSIGVEYEKQSQFEIIPEIDFVKQCECGGKKLGTTHSDWCPKY